MMDDEHILSITFNFPNGEEGIDSDSNTPLGRAFAKLLGKTGKQFKKIQKCFLQTDAGEYKWLGVFVYSAGGRIILFPGLKEIYPIIYQPDGSSQAFTIGHLSLDKTGRRWKRWHLTDSASGEHTRSFRTKPIGKNRVIWFSLSLASLDVLKTVKQKTVVEARVPASDSTRRAETIMTSRENQVFRITHLAPGAKEKYKTGYPYSGGV